MSSSDAREAAEERERVLQLEAGAEQVGEVLSAHGTGLVLAEPGVETGRVEHMGTA